MTKEEGASHTVLRKPPPAVLLPHDKMTSKIEMSEGTEMVMPGDNLKCKVSLIALIAMEEKLRFAIREGCRTVGAGVVSKILI